MRIRHYLYNAFIVENANMKLVIDPGRNLWWLKMNSLIPKKEWKDVTHVFVTHGDPDHFDFAVPLAEQSDAEVICHKELTEKFNNQSVKGIQTLKVDEALDLGDVKVQGLNAKHGPLAVNLGGGLMYMRNEVLEATHGGQEVYLAGKQVQKVDEPLQVYNHGTVKLLWGLIRLEKDNIEDFARGVIGYKITIGDKSVVNLGDTLLQEGWEDLKPDVLMIPIRTSIGNTMDVEDALEAVRIMQPKLVIPCHYNASFLWKRNISPTDDKSFKVAVEKMGIKCQIMKYGDELTV